MGCFPDVPEKRRWTHRLSPFHGELLAKNPNTTICGCCAGLSRAAADSEMLMRVTWVMSLRFCSCIRFDPNDSNLKRPDPFGALPGSHRIYQEFRRQENR